MKRIWGQLGLTARTLVLALSLSAITFAEGCTKVTPQRDAFRVALMDKWPIDKQII